jgi:3-mercaptopyruvate sulfurtransferase SseA
MQRLLEYATHHQPLALFAVAAVTAVLMYELRERARGVGAIGAQDVVRLMNQGAVVLDVRSAEDYAAGHIRGARSVPATQLTGAWTR